MLTTNDYYLDAELAYRRERLARTWARSSGSTRGGRRRGLRLPRRSTLRLPSQRPRGASLA